jgi:hypothetical protein
MPPVRNALPGPPVRDVVPGRPGRHRGPGERDGARTARCRGVGDDQGQPGDHSEHGGQHRNEAATAGRSGQLMTGHT